jgi:hypothetical protein
MYISQRMECIFYKGWNVYFTKDGMYISQNKRRDLKGRAPSVLHFSAPEAP